MNNDAAVSLLGLTGTPTAAEVNIAHKTISEKIKVRLNSAPTDALKKKYGTALARVDRARSILTTGVSAPAADPTTSPELSHTKMADLPAAAPLSHHGSTGGSGAGATAAIAPGQVLAERYEVRQLLGTGGMGAVYAANDRLEGSMIAVKVLLPGLIANEQAQERFFSEGKTSKQLSHPNIINVFDVGRSGPHFFLTMELLEGQTLREQIEVRKIARTEYSAEDIFDLMKQIGDALQYAHQRMVHRDLKPENIFVCEDGTIKVMDFGIARLMTGTQMTKTGMALGTAYYMAPEQLTGTGKVDQRADQYSLGVIIYELLTGQLPAGATAPVNHLRKDIPKGMATTIMRAIAPKQEDRFPDMAAFAKAIRRKRGGRIPSSTTSHSGLAGKVLAAGVALLVLAGGAYVALETDVLENILPASAAERQALRAVTFRLNAQLEQSIDAIEAHDSELSARLRDLQSDIGRLESQIANARDQEQRGASSERLAMKETERDLVREEIDDRAQYYATPYVQDARSELAVAEAFIKTDEYTQTQQLLAPAISRLDDAAEVFEEYRATRFELARDGGAEYKLVMAAGGQPDLALAPALRELDAAGTALRSGNLESARGKLEAAQQLGATAAVDFVSAETARNRQLAQQYIASKQLGEARSAINRAKELEALLGSQMAGLAMRGKTQPSRESEGEYFPIAKVAPIYPRRALSRGVEGYCVVEYTVTKHGAVRDPVVLKDQCTSALFYSESLAAALNFKYKPRVIDGEAVAVYGVLNKFTYKISN